MYNCVHTSVRSDKRITMDDIVIASNDMFTQLTTELLHQQIHGIYVDLELAFKCGTTCSVHKCVMAAVSR